MNPLYSGAVVSKKESRKQQLLFGHTSDVSILAITQDGQFLASGQKGKLPMIKIWALNRPKGASEMETKRAAAAAAELQSVMNEEEEQGARCTSFRLFLLCPFNCFLLSLSLSLLHYPPPLTQ